MRNVPEICIRETSDSVIKFQEKRSSLRFSNENRRTCKCITVDGCAITDGERCDNALCSVDGRDEFYIELKGSDIIHAIEQIRATIIKLGEYDDNRHSYVVCTKVAPHITTKIQKAKLEFKSKFNSELLIKETPLKVKL